MLGMHMSVSVGPTGTMSYEVDHVIKGEQASALGITENCSLDTVNGEVPTSMMHLLKMLDSHKFPLPCVFRWHNKRTKLAADKRASVMERKAAKIVTAFIREVWTRARGVVYTRSFEKGRLGFSVKQMQVNGVDPGGQADTLGVRDHSLILTVGGQIVTSDIECVMLFKMRPRPLTLKLAMVSYETLLWRFSGNMTSGKEKGELHSWKDKMVR